MKELLNQLSEYHGWATKRMAETTKELPEDFFHKEIDGSFTTLYKMILHILDAESIWWQRMKMEERIVIPSETFKGTMEELIRALLAQSELWREWLAKASDLSIEHVFHYYNKKNDLNKVVVSQLLLHVFNHGTYHRGQWVTALRKLGTEKIPATDFIVWTRTKK